LARHHHILLLHWRRTLVQYIIFEQGKMLLLKYCRKDKVMLIYYRPS